jgi:hypothetical protein
VDRLCHCVTVSRPHVCTGQSDSMLRVPATDTAGSSAVVSCVYQVVSCVLFYTWSQLCIKLTLGCFNKNGDQYVSALCSGEDKDIRKLSRSKLFFRVKYSTNKI